MAKALQHFSTITVPVYREHATICEECDWVNPVPALQEGQRLRCQRCHHELVRWPRRVIEQLIGYSSASLVMLMMAASFPFLGFFANGATRQMSLIDTVSVLSGYHFTLLASLLGIVLFALPIGYLFSVLYLCWAIRFQWRLPGLKKVTQAVLFSQGWLMVDVFLVGSLVALIKLRSMAQIDFGLSFWAFAGYALLLVKTMSLVDRRWLWNQIAGPAPVTQVTAGEARSQQVCSCQQCGAIVSGELGYCPRCGHYAVARHPRTLSRTLALLIAACAMYLPANLLPIMSTTFLGETNHSTILGGVVMLWGMESYPVAIIIFIASVLIPLAKILALAWLCWQVRWPTNRAIRKKQYLYQITEIIGRWSMIDVFVVAILAALVRLGNLISVMPGPAALSFAAVVVLTMVAARQFDPRLLWDSAGERKETMSE